MNSRTKGFFLTLLCVTMWGTVPVVSKLGQTAMDNHQFLFWSSLTSFLVLLNYSMIAGKASKYRKISIKDWGKLLFLGLLGSYVYYLFLYLGYAKAKGLDVLVIQYTWPVQIVIFSVPLLKERLTLRKLIAAILCFCGVVLVLSKGNVTSLKIDNASVILLVLLGTNCFALFSVLAKKIKHDPVCASCIYFLSATVASMVSMICFSDFTYPASSELFPVLMNGIIVNGFSYVFWIRALECSEASFIAPFTFLTPVMSLCYLVLFFDEALYPVHGAGLFLVICGGLVNSFFYKSLKK